MDLGEPARLLSQAVVEALPRFLASVVDAGLISVRGVPLSADDRLPMVVLGVIVLGVFGLIGRFFASGRR